MRLDSSFCCVFLNLRLAFLKAYPLHISLTSTQSDISDLPQGIGTSLYYASRRTVPLYTISALHSSMVCGVFFFVMVGRSFLLIGIEKGQSIFSAALVGGYSILVCCFQIYKIACCSAIAIFSIPFSCYFINISAQFKSEYVSNNSYIFAVCSRLSPMFVTPALHT